MNKIILEKLIYKNYLKTALTSILFIEIILVIIYFSVNKNMVDTSIDFILNDVKKSAYTNVNNVTLMNEHKFKNIENAVILLQNEHQNFFINDYKLRDSLNPVFKYAENGMYYKAVDNMGSSVLVSKNTIITPEIKAKLENSELLDSTIKLIVDNNEMITAAYFNSHDNISRYYPFLEDVFSLFPSDIDMGNYNFYYKANLENNPKKELVWTDIYLDPAGKGWMLSVIAPIYNNDFLEGVIGVDLTIDSIINNFLDFELPYNGSSFLIDEDGKIIAMTEEIEKIFNIKNNSKYQFLENKKLKDNNIFEYSNKKFVNDLKNIVNGLNLSTDKVKERIHENKDNIFEYPNKKLVNNLKNVVNGLNFSHDNVINNRNYMLFSKKIEKTSWVLISLIDEEEIISEVLELEEYYKKLGYLIILFIFIFYILFFIYLYKKSKSFVLTINTPILKIIEMTKSLGKNKKNKKLEACGIIELDTLSENFNNLSNELEERTRKLVESEAKRLLNEKLANTDALTNVYNRRFLEDFSNNYLKILKREKKKLSLLVIDIDDFKNINDTYGHEVGDIVIKDLVTRINNVIRENDILVRYGGDEFIILLPNSDISNAKKIGKKIIKNINLINELEEKKVNFSISVGAGEYKETDTDIEAILRRADEALYKAKSDGKSCVR